MQGITVDPMAAQMAQLLVASDVDELREVVKRWVAEAPTEGTRRTYENFGARMIELKAALAEQPVQPTREELETALTMMLRLAAQHGGGPPQKPVIDDLPPSLLRVFAALFGLLWGSFLNVVIYRVPRGMSVVRPPSHCPGCGKPIKPYDNVPLLSFAILRGRARCCGAKMSLRYPIVEAIGGLLSIAVLEACVFPLGPTTTFARAGAVYFADFALAMALVATAFIDLEFMIVPKTVTYGGALLGLATSSFRDLGFVDALVGAAVGFAVVWLPFIVLYPRLRGGKAGMGQGDAELLMLAGAWFGWQGALFALGAGAVQGTIATIGMLLLGKRPEDPEAVQRERAELEAEMEKLTAEERAELEAEIADDPLYGEAEPGLGRARIAFGPFLILAILECLLVGREALWGGSVGVMDRVVRAVGGLFGVQL